MSLSLSSVLILTFCTIVSQNSRWFLKQPYFDPLWCAGLSHSYSEEWQAAKLCPALCKAKTVAQQAPPSMGFFRQEHWSGLPCPPPGDLPNPGIKPKSLMSPAWADGYFTTSDTWEVFFDPLVEVLIYRFLKCIRYLFWASQRIVRDTKQRTQARPQYA